MNPSRLLEKISIKLRDTLLERAFFYDLYQYLIGGGNMKRFFVREFIRPKPGDRILDIGCGTAELLGYMEGVEYFGMDSNAHYISTARNKYGSKGEFVQSLIEDFSPKENYYDTVVANGVLHHLPDAIALKLFEIASRALKPTGRLVTLDGCYWEGQSKIDYFLLKQDRGEFVRTEKEYTGLAKKVFSKIKPILSYDLLRVPYTTLSLECTK